MRACYIPGPLLCGALVVLCSLLAGCGAMPAGVPGASGRTPASGQTPGTHSSWPPTSTTPTPGSHATATPGAVRLVLDKTAYTPGTTALVKIENGLGVAITVTDHHTDCRFVVLEELLGAWQTVGKCPLMTVTRQVNLAQGSVTPQYIGIPNGPGAAGTYRIVLPYFPAAGAPPDAIGPAYSATFTVG